MSNRRLQQKVLHCAEKVRAELPRLFAVRDIDLRLRLLRVLILPCPGLECVNFDQVWQQIDDLLDRRLVLMTKK